MMADGDISKAKDSLLKFMGDMKKWEEHYFQLFKFENGGPEKNGKSALDDLVQIYDKYLTKKDRKTGRMAGPHAGYPAEYDPNQEVIELEEVVNKNKIVFVATWTHPALLDCTEKRRYTMVRVREEWLLDKRESFSRYRKKWVNSVL